MDNLPSELLHEVVDFFVDDPQSLKALRLVDRRFADIAVKYLYRRLVIFQHPDSWDKLELIAASPQLAPLVQNVDVTALTPASGFGRIDFWKESSKEIRMKERLGNRAGQVAILMDSLNDPELDVVLGTLQRFQRYRRWCNGEEAIEEIMDISEGQTPLMVLPLPNLRAVHVAGPTEDWMPGPKIKRRERETGLQASHRLMRHNNQAWNCHLSFALRDLHLNKIQITTLELHEYRQILVDQMYPVPVMSQLKTLILGFRYQFAESFQFTHPDESKKPKWRLAPFLAGAENLTTLAMAQDFKTFRPNSVGMQEMECAWIDMFPILADAQWPKLRQLNLYNVLLRSTSLLAFLDQHSDSLESVRIKEPITREQPWRALTCTIFERFSMAGHTYSCSEECFWPREDDEDNEDRWPWFGREDAVYYQ
jgi:hypothetical protein